MTEPWLHRQCGFALIAVMLIGAMAMYVVSGMIGRDVIADRHNQNLELLKLRSYWAAQGHLS
jgi:hypothetical protein